jgi:arsenical pump membrane protein
MAERSNPVRRALGQWSAGALLAVVGSAGALVAAAIDPAAARSAASQDWSPFVLVAGLLLVGLAADEGGLFSAAGRRLAGATESGVLLFAGAAVLVAAITALLNLDTSVAFLAPVMVYTARQRGWGEAPLLYGCLLLSNAASVLLPGSNLTNLIVLGHFRLSGGEFLARMAPAWVVAVLVTAAVVGVAERRSLRPPVAPQLQARSEAQSEAKSEQHDVQGGAQTERHVGTEVERLCDIHLPATWLGLVAVLAVTVLVVTLRSPALPVFGAGVVVTAARSARSRDRLGHVIEVLGWPVLAGLFGLAVALGTVGRAWSGPADLIAHLDPWATAAVAAVATVLVNNLPAASLLAARVPKHPYALLIGLNLGPNLFVSGSLAWILWLRAARNAGARPSIAHASRLGAVAVPLSMAAALGALTLTGSH